jgi:hypothetical protein
MPNETIKKRKNENNWRGLNKNDKKNRGLQDEFF